MRGKEGVMENSVVEHAVNNQYQADMKESENGEHVASGSFQVDLEAMKKKTDEINLKISNSSVAAFFKEFPFLTKFVNAVEVTQSSVSRIDEKILLKSCHICDGNDILLLNENGGELVRIGKELGPKPSWWRSAPRINNVGEALDYLRKLNKAQEAKFVFSIVNCRQVIWLYVAPKGFSIPGWIEELTNLASAKLKDELRRIDAEAEMIKRAK